MELARETWTKVKDIGDNRAGAPVELEAVALDECLLVDTFGMWERHAGSDWKVRIISNFKSNMANECAWMPTKLRYDGFSELGEAAGKLKEFWDGDLCMGKADFKSAFKTLPRTVINSGSAGHWCTIPIWKDIKLCRCIANPLAAWGQSWRGTRP